MATRYRLNRSVYANLSYLRQPWLLGNANLSDDILWDLALGVSEWIDGYCGDRFAPRVERLYYVGNGTSDLDIDPLIELGPVTLLPNYHIAQDGVEIAAEDMTLLPPGQRPVAAGYGFNGPWRRIRFDEVTPDTSELVSVLGLFSHGGVVFPIPNRMAASDRSELVDTDVFQTITVNDRTLAGGMPVTSLADAGFEVGDTLLFGDLNIDVPASLAGTVLGRLTSNHDVSLVTGLAVVGGEVVATVRRAINGTLAYQAPASVPVVRRYEPPQNVKLACGIMCARLYSRGPTFEPFYVDADLDTDVYGLLEPWRFNRRVT